MTDKKLSARDLPEEYLDERQARVRDRAYVEAYPWFASLALLGATLSAVLWILLALREPDRT